VSDPTCLDLGNLLDTVHGGGLGDVFDDLWVHGVKKPLANVGRGANQDEENHHGDEQTDQRVSPVESAGDLDGTDDDQERGDPIGPSELAVRFECGRSDPATDTGSILGDHSFPRTPMSPATTTQGRCEIFSGWTKRSIAL